MTGDELLHAREGINSNGHGAKSVRVGEVWSKGLGCSLYAYCVCFRLAIARTPYTSHESQSPHVSTDALEVTFALESVPSQPPYGVATTRPFMFVLRRST